jgi:hypothetical protein
VKVGTLVILSLGAIGCTREVVLAEGTLEEDLPRVTRSDVAQACERLCDSTGSCGPWRGFCSTACEAVLVEGCEAEAEALLVCLAEQAACEIGDSPCAEAFDAIVACAEPDHCDASACIVEPGTCSCAGVCGGDFLVQECESDEDGGATCRCLRGDQVVRTCDVALVGCTFASCCSETPL